MQKVTLPTLLKAALYFNRFRGKPAIPKFDKPFTPNPRSSQHFATYTGSVLTLLDRLGED